MPLTMPPSSASPELRVMIFCVEAQCLTRWVPRRMHPPDVLLRVRVQPAKSVSTHTRRGAVGCHAYLYATRGSAARYLTTRASAGTSDRLGADMRRQSSLVAKEMSGRSRAR